MMPKITKEMREALRCNSGRPLEVEDEHGNALYVLIDKDTFAQLREAQGQAEETTRRHLRSLIEEGIASGDYQPADAVFADLQHFADALVSGKTA